LEVQVGFISFMKDAGKKIGLFAEEAAAERAEAKEAPPTPEQRAERNAKLAEELLGAVDTIGLPTENLSITFRGGVATLTGSVPTQAEREKIVLVIGNVEGVGGVEDQLEVVSPEPPAVYHTVAKGDSLSAISRTHYGVLPLYDMIFDANKPMLKDPDEIYPGQVLRIPPIEAPTYTVAKGDTLGKIAKHWYGDAKKYTAIYEANTDKLSSPDAIDIGQVLTIPVEQPKAPEPVEAPAVS